MVIKYLILLTIKAEYLFHQHTNKLLGMGNVGNYKNRKTNDSFLLAEDRMQNAIEFERIMVDDGSGTEIKIKDKKSNLNLSINGGKAIFEKNNNSTDQKFDLIMQNEGKSFIIKNKNGCINYNAREKTFDLGNCENLEQSRFEMRNDRSIDDKRDKRYHKKLNNMFYSKDRETFLNENRQYEAGNLGFPDRVYDNHDQDSSTYSIHEGGYPIYSGDRYSRIVRLPDGTRVDNHEIIRKNGKVYTDDDHKRYITPHYRRNRQLERKNHSRADANFYSKENIFGKKKQKLSVFSKYVLDDNYSHSEIDEALYFD